MSLENQNPFFFTYNTPHETIPFNKIKNEHFESAIDKGIENHSADINSITSSEALADFQNTIEQLEQSGKLLSQVTSVFFNLLNAEANEEMHEIAQRIQPKLSAHYDDIYLNSELFERIKSVHENRFTANLTSEQIRLTEKIFEGFENSGATLSGEDKERYKLLSAKLSQVTLMFGQNTLKETNSYELILVDESDLKGLPKSTIDAAKKKAETKNKEGWIFDLSAPSYIAFMKYSVHRNLREKLYMAYTTRCVNGGEFDNQENVKEIVNSRLEIANLLGYPDYATYVLRNKMAKNKENVFGLLDQLFDAYRASAECDVEKVKMFANEMEGKPVELKPWDWSYYSEKLKDVKYTVNDEMVRPYFELENVKKGVFGLATDLYDITFVANKEIPVYHPEVEAFEVFGKNNNYLAVLYTDFHPCEGKQPGAWMTEFKGQYIKDGRDSRPHVSIVMNFTRPTETEPALLTFDEVNTFLHEFGHALHGMLTKCSYEALSGTNVEHDFVELPSQIMENWLTEKEYLDRFAFHYKTGEKIPSDLVHKLIDSANFNAGYACYRQLSFGYLDMAWHTISQAYNEDIKLFEQNAMSKTALLPSIESVNMSASFGHIFSGGYAAGYYGYKWAEVLDADAFEKFKETGIFNKETADAFRKNILEKGNTRDPMKLYIDFRGQKPSINALMKRNGID